MGLKLRWARSWMGAQNAKSQIQKKDEIALREICDLCNLQQIPVFVFLSIEISSRRIPNVKINSLNQDSTYHLQTKLTRPHTEPEKIFKIKSNFLLYVFFLNTLCGFSLLRIYSILRSRMTLCSENAYAFEIQRNENVYVFIFHWADSTEFM